MDIECRGRNGWFSFGETEVFGSDDTAWVEVFSTRKGKCGPIVLRGKPNELIRIFEDVLDRLRKITTKAKLFTVIGIWLDTEQRFLEYVEALSAEDAEKIVLQQHPGLTVAGVMEGRQEAASPMTELESRLANLLDNTAASLENVLLHHSERMTPADVRGRRHVLEEAQQVLKLKQDAEADLVEWVEVRVEAASEKLHELDVGVPGTYPIRINPPLPRSEAAEAAFDAFHASEPIAVLEDFHISAYDLEGIELI